MKEVEKKKCIGCGACASSCPVGAISFDNDGKAVVNEEICIQCGACVSICPMNAIKEK